MSMLKKWWLIRQFHDDVWYPAHLYTFFDIPLCSFFYTASGPYESEKDAENMIPYMD